MANSSRNRSLLPNRSSSPCSGMLILKVRNPGRFQALGMPSWRRMALKERGITIPEVMLIAGTRVALGLGIGLLIADRLNKDQRNGVGWALLGVSVLTTIPLARAVLGKPPVGERSIGS